MVRTLFRNQALGFIDWYRDYLYQRYMEEYRSMANPAARTWFFYLSPDGKDHKDVVLQGDDTTCQMAATAVNNSLSALRASGVIGHEYALAIAAPFIWDFNKPFTGK